MLISCSALKREKEIQIKIVSDYCQLYSKFPEDTTPRVKEYWTIKKKIIKEKTASGEILTPEEELLKIFVIYSGKNESKYNDKCEPIDVN